MSLFKKDHLEEIVQNTLKKNYYILCGLKLKPRTQLISQLLYSVKLFSVKSVYFAFFHLFYVIRHYLQFMLWYMYLSVNVENFDDFALVWMSVIQICVSVRVKTFTYIRRQLSIRKRTSSLNYGVVLSCRNWHTSILI